MKKLLTITIATTLGLCAIAQKNVGVNTNTPTTTLHVVGDPTNTAVADGITIPSLTGDQLKAKDAKYGSTETGAMVYATAAVGTASTKTAKVTAAGFYYFDGSIWQKVTSSSYTSGQVVNSVVLISPTISNLVSSSTTGTWLDVISYTYTPLSTNSKILVQYHNGNYAISGNGSLAAVDEYQSQLLIGGSTIVVNKQTCSQINGVSTYDIFRSGTVFPIAGAKTNAALTPVAIKVQMTRSSGDDGLTIGGTTTVNNGTLIIQEIAN